MSTQLRAQLAACQAKVKELEAALEAEWARPRPKLCVFGEDRRYTVENPKRSLLYYMCVEEAPCYEWIRSHGFDVEEQP